MKSPLPTNTKKKENTHPCKSCGKETVYCPQCDGMDDYVKEGQYGGFWVCQDEDCESYQFCCGC